MNTSLGCADPTRLAQFFVPLRRTDRLNPAVTDTATNAVATGLTFGYCSFDSWVVGGCDTCDPPTGIDGAPEAGSVDCNRPAPKESVDCWPLAINITTHSGVRPCTDNRLRA